MKVLEHPIHPNRIWRGDTFSHLTELDRQYPAAITLADWTDTVIRDRSMVTPLFRVSTELTYTVGDVGMAYVCYRLKNYLDQKIAMKHFRAREFSQLNAMLKDAHARLMSQYRHEGRGAPKFVFSSVDGELLGVLTGYYTPVHDSVLFDLIHSNELHGRVARWEWNPTRLRMFLRSGETTGGFLKWGVSITNGETGHVALSFRSSLWTDRVNGYHYDFTPPVVMHEHRRHMSAKLLASTLSSMQKAIDENIMEEILAYAEKNLSGRWAWSFAESHWEDVRGRDSAKAKLYAKVDAEMALARAGSCLDFIVTILEVGASVNKSVAAVAERIVQLILDEVFERVI